MVAARYKEVLSCGVGVNDLVLRSVEDGAVDRQHCRDAQYLVGTLVPRNITHFNHSTLSVLMSDIQPNTNQRQCSQPTLWDCISQSWSCRVSQLRDQTDSYTRLESSILDKCVNGIFINSTSAPRFVLHRV